MPVRAMRTESGDPISVIQSAIYGGWTATSGPTRDVWHCPACVTATV